MVISIPNTLRRERVACLVGRGTLTMKERNCFDRRHAVCGKPFRETNHSDDVWQPDRSALRFSGWVYPAHIIMIPQIGTGRQTGRRPDRQTCTQACTCMQAGRPLMEHSVQRPSALCTLYSSCTPFYDPVQLQYSGKQYIYSAHGLVQRASIYEYYTTHTPVQ